MQGWGMNTLAPDHICRWKGAAIACSKGLQKSNGFNEAHELYYSVIYGLHFLENSI